MLACALTPTGHGPPLTPVNRVVSWPTMDGFCSIAARVVDSTLVSVVLYGTPLKRASLESSSLECASLECPSLEDCLHVLVLICIVSGLLGPLDLAEYRLMQRLHQLVRLLLLIPSRGWLRVNRRDIVLGACGADSSWLVHIALGPCSRVLVLQLESAHLVVELGSLHDACASEVILIDVHLLDAWRYVSALYHHCGCSCHQSSISLHHAHIRGILGLQ